MKRVLSGKGRVGAAGEEEAAGEAGMVEEAAAAAGAAVVTVATAIVEIEPGKLRFRLAIAE
jgi:hypothetical protein